ncbi:hypothetical protein SDC9_152092 [bioreactor metagenome]|uniref:Uncharacterized protein n=1 Tax=bioreactor metagenome TaxID=1076179 RepID=A0A645EWL0_9ZZZZ
MQAGIVVLVFRGYFMERTPGTQIRPPEVGANNVHVVRLFHYPIIDGDVGAKRKCLVDELFLPGSVKKLPPLVELIHDIG